ncbi:hypothetical protein [Pedobacter montanisoli]|uniref:Outer membrane protein beta-barrel domain-containing protein n=1 Tax=Pedobacter montanisoli TaxID=2923277 RepID=A0ABS9ZUL4_9SPHI|nr:hypothetical protein [Pedobacter montanisoli]MCJ0742062.1 hypothetical protein [Pedobacter montanisoli]
MKKICAAFILSIFTSVTYAQSNFYKLGVGLGAGGTYSFTDVKKGKFGLAGYGTVEYYLTPFITSGLELQMGTVKGGDVKTDPHNREFFNTYKAITLGGKVRLGQFTDFYYNDLLNYTKGFYIGTGVGVILNNMKDIIRTKPDGSGYVFPGKDKSVNAAVPINVGIDFYFPDQWGDIRYGININYQTNFTFGEGLDGYDDPKTKFKNVSPDLYTYFSVGVRYNFGFMGLTSKPVR